MNLDMLKALRKAVILKNVIVPMNHNLVGCHWYLFTGFISHLTVEHALKMFGNFLIFLEKINNKT